MHIGRGYLTGVVHDSLDVEYVVVHAIRQDSGLEPGGAVVSRARGSIATERCSQTVEGRILDGGQDGGVRAATALTGHPVRATRP